MTEKPLRPARWPVLAAFVFFWLLRVLLLGGFWLLLLLAVLTHLARLY